MPSLSYGNIDFCTEYGDHDYARTFEFAAKVLSLRENYKPDEFLSDRVLEIRVHFDLHNVFEHTQRQNGIEWHGARANTMTSTVDVLPTEVDRLNAAEQSLIRDDIGKHLTSQSDADKSEEFLQYQDQSSKDLHKLTVKRLQDICKHYQHPYSNRRKTEIVDQVKKGPKTTETITEQERFLKKHSFPLCQIRIDRHGSLDHSTKEKYVALLTALSTGSVVNLLMGGSVDCFATSSTCGWLLR